MIRNARASVSLCTGGHDARLCALRILTTNPDIYSIGLAIVLVANPTALWTGTYSLSCSMASAAYHGDFSTI